MTKPMPDADLADLRNMLKRSNMFVGEIRGSFTTEEALVPLGSVDIGDVRALVAGLDAAEERRDLAEDLLREVANSGVEFDDERIKWCSVQIGRDTLAQCRSYLR